VTLAGEAWRLQAWARSSDLENTSAAVAAGRVGTTPANDQYSTPASGYGLNAAWQHKAGDWSWELGGDVRATEGRTNELFRYMAGAFTRQRTAGGRTLVGGLYAEAAYAREDFSLTPVPRLGTYRGLVFASLSDSGISLDEHLGQVKEYIDLFMDVSPTGEAELCTGIQKLRYNGNWKFLPENSLEGDYHGPFLHRIAFELHGKRTGLDLSSLYQNEVPDVIRSLPGGHMVEDYRGASMAAPARKPTPARLAYVEMMEKRYGKQKAAALLGTTPPLVYVFPNLIYIMTHIRRVQPVSVDETHVYYQPLLFKGDDFRQTDIEAAI
jgi:hypothetical protein